VSAPREVELQIQICCSMTPLPSPTSPTTRANGTGVDLTYTKRSPLRRRHETEHAAIIGFTSDEAPSFSQPPSHVPSAPVYECGGYPSEIEKGRGTQTGRVDFTTTASPIPHTRLAGALCDRLGHGIRLRRYKPCLVGPELKRDDGHNFDGVLEGEDAVSPLALAAFRGYLAL
jgi:hypothetical protein